MRVRLLGRAVLSCPGAPRPARVAVGAPEDLVQHVFGPVPSRRLGQSLGVDPLPFKTCNWNCVYCQLGRTARLSLERREFVPVEAVLSEVREALAAPPPQGIDWITFAGSGEPTLHSGLGRMIRGVRELTSVPIAVITNGSLLHLPEVRAELAPAAAVLPSVDAGNEQCYRAINRAAPALAFQRFVAGLIDFRRGYSGRLLAEVMLVAGVNDADAELRDIAALLERVEPDEVHISTAVRPPAEAWVRPLSEERLARAAELLGPRARLLGLARGEFGASGLTEIADAVVAVVMRHPMTEEELRAALGRWSAGEIELAAKRLEHDGRLREVRRGGRRFWCYAGGRYREGGKGPASR